MQQERAAPEGAAGEPAGGEALLEGVQAAVAQGECGTLGEYEEWMGSWGGLAEEVADWLGREEGLGLKGGEGVKVSHPVSATTGNLVQTAWIVRLGWLPGGGSRDSWWQLKCQQLRPCSLWQQRRLGRLGRRSELGQRWRICLLCTTRHGKLRG